MSGEAKTQKAILELLYTKPIDGFSLAAVSQKLEHDHQAVKVCMGRLCARGFILRLERGVFQITPEGMEAFENPNMLRSGPPQGHTGQRATNRCPSLRQKAWNVMRMGEPFDVEELAMLADTGDASDPQANLRRYVKALVEAGYCIKLPTVRRGTRPGSTGFPRYRLVENTGPLAPVHKVRSKPPVMFDHNLGETSKCA